VDGINKKTTTLILLTVVACAAITGGFLLMKQASGASDTNNTIVTNTNGAEWWSYGGTGFEPRPAGGPGRNRGCYPVEVSDEYVQKVIAIADNDSDVQNLLAAGYNITSVRPIIKNVIDANGYLTTRATTAVLVLQKDSNNIARVTVDIDQGKVTQIVTLTRTVIDKSSS
jgi:hypothetical protein